MTRLYFRREQTTSIHTSVPVNRSTTALQSIIRIVSVVAIFLAVSTNGITMAQELSDVVRWNNGKAYFFYKSGQYIRYARWR